LPKKRLVGDEDQDHDVANIKLKIGDAGAVRPRRGDEPYPPQNDVLRAGWLSRSVRNEFERRLDIVNPTGAGLTRREGRNSDDRHNGSGEGSEYVHLICPGIPEAVTAATCHLETMQTACHKN
jgi:hypothetical protein